MELLSGLRRVGGGGCFIPGLVFLAPALLTLASLARLRKKTLLQVLLATSARWRGRAVCLPEWEWSGADISRTDNVCDSQVFEEVATDRSCQQSSPFSSCLVEKKKRNITRIKKLLASKICCRQFRRYNMQYCNTHVCNMPYASRITRLVASFIQSIVCMLWREINFLRSAHGSIQFSFNIHYFCLCSRTQS